MFSPFIVTVSLLLLALAYFLFQLFLSLRSSAGRKRTFILTDWHGRYKRVPVFHVRVMRYQRELDSLELVPQYVVQVKTGFFGPWMDYQEFDDEKPASDAAYRLHCKLFDARRDWEKPEQLVTRITSDPPNGRLYD